MTTTIKYRAMKKNLLLLIALLTSIVVFGQSDYSRGFQNGYKEGYCYNDFGCISPIPPITPIPLIGESYDNYQDGYNRGFKRGLEDKQAKKSNSGGYNSGQGTYVPQQQYQSTYVAPDYSLLIKAMEMKQAQYERNEQLKKEKAIGMMNQVKAYYNSLTTFPEKIPDGWYKVISMNNYDFCDERKVYVSNNKVTKYIIDDWINRKISYPVSINKGKAMIQLVLDDGSNGDMVELYFLEFMNNPSAYTTPPVVSGKISFWSNFKGGGNISVYIEGTYIGEIKSYFKEGTPNCGQSGTLTFEYKPGTYNYKASNNNRTWSGTITITSGSCSLRGLVK